MPARQKPNVVVVTNSAAFPIYYIVSPVQRRQNALNMLLAINQSPSSAITFANSVYV